MARGAVAVRGLPGAVAGLVLAALMLGTLGVVLAHAGGMRLTGPDWAAVRFTLVQAALSAAISVVLAVPVARALARRRFAGRRLLIAALGAPFLMPVIVAVLGLLAIFGRGGVLNAGLAAVGLPPVQVYGLHGVVLAHVFLNLPLAVRMVLQGWQAIPAERFRTAAALGFGPAEVARHLERPMLREVLPGAALAVFLICLASFAAALILGGGPRATTVEVAIYQAVRFEFDLSRAAALAAVQFALCAGAVLLAARVAVPAGFGGGLDRAVQRWDAGRWGLRLLDGAVIALAAAFLFAPLLAVILRGLPGLAALPAPVWAAAGRSVVMALVSAALVLAGALALGQLAVRGGVAGRLAELAGMLPLAASSLVLGAGLFIAVLPFAAPETVALPVTVLVNAAMALPFALRLILPALREVEATQMRLAESLGIGGWARLRLVTLPRLRRPLGFAGGVAAALAMGDLGVIALFAGEGNATLPMQVWRLMGAFRTEAAEAAAVLLLAASFGLFWVMDRGGGRDDAGA
ncbi:thiamine/thiamine pyrophosphate ABC transporter permease ThiP [Ruixingdingia sedimenti]|uniref:Thiamine/thiamine pyrophosphate ABC transporter permease ThiP n=1 Tax=Ruixingdingia sedimenti TaxID=3073604 RepID=A0ABU1F848_9RHOB|nr:thiamine/thiamine pyrophosphate ABC transporter permease ThiP [Xinfangfangia sp. LG-4]MDR5653051.1 thiamine/thiamine pyrophosphate ABC transporter permease ThiP [Xinfangfangia sp. LG-4]